MPRNKTMTAHCTVHGEGCRRSRTVTESGRYGREGQGRPIGLLVAWLQDPDNHADLPRTFVHPRPRRQQARQMFSILEGSRLFSKHEREKRPGEADEPTDIP